MLLLQGFEFCVQHAGLSGRTEALASITENYDVLQLTWEAARDAVRNTEMRARISSVAAQMEKFDFFFGVELGRKVLNVVDNLSHTLQATAISACEAQTVVSLTVTTLQSMRSDECFDMFWQYVEHRRASLDSDVLSNTSTTQKDTKTLRNWKKHA